jgi:hypothetical protein
MNAKILKNNMLRTSPKPIPDYFLNLLRPTPARPTKPVPSSISVAGSGTGEAPSPPTFGFVTTLDVVALGAGSSDEGQPTIPKNIITIHKNINNFFILLSP